MMKTLTCKATRRRLQAHHDAELSVSEQIAVSAHLDWCEECASEFDELQSLRVGLRLAMRERVAVADEFPGFQENIVGLLKAEEGVSLTSRIQGMFEDMRLVYAGLGASMAAIACVLLMLNMMRFVKEDQRPDSLAAIMRVLASSEASQAHMEAISSGVPRRREGMSWMMRSMTSAVVMDLSLAVAT